MNRYTNNGNPYFNETNIYDELAKLKTASLQLPTYRTVFTDIADEWNKCTAEEQSFINNDENYVKTNLKYQQAFSSFLLEMWGQQFIASPYGKTAEEVLIALRGAKDKYRQKTDTTVKDVQEQNRLLLAEIEQLKKAIKEGKPHERQGNIV